MRDRHPKRVLVVDDDPLIRGAVTLALRAAGYEVVTAENGVEGLAVANEAPPDVILLDLMMPVMSGWEVLRAREHHSALANVPVLVLSAARAEELASAKALGAPYLVKPFDLDVLVTMLEQLTHAAEERARFEGVMLAVRTMQHHLNNHLARVVGFSELMSADPRLPPDLRVLADEAMAGALAAAETLDQLAGVTGVDLAHDTPLPILRLESAGEA